MFHLCRPAPYVCLLWRAGEPFYPLYQLAAKGKREATAHYAQALNMSVEELEKLLDNDAVFKHGTMVCCSTHCLSYSLEDLHSRIEPCPVLCTEVGMSLN
jgi:hypothetical protein